jgi:hypothetical protein
VNIDQLLRRHGLVLFDAFLAEIHGGSMIGFIAPQGKRSRTERLLHLLAQERDAKSNDIETYLDFARRVEAMKARDLAYLDSVKGQGKRIFGMGAPVKGNTLLNYCGIGRRYLDCLVEKNPLRRGLYSPGMHLPIVMEDELSSRPDVYYVLAWNFKQEILANNRDLLEQGVDFYFPVDTGAA